MKTLQNNFTTPEQSKRLLELGVPADSADCYYTSYGAITAIPNGGYDDKRIFLQEIGCTLCWSVGRLIEIYGICTEFKNAFVLDNCHNPIDTMMNKIEALVKHGYDFSKLED